MSGTMPAAVAEAATAIALRAEADARGLRIGRVVAERLHDALEARKQRAETIAGRTWREMPANVRTVFVMLEAEAEGDPRTLAMQPWESFSARDRAAIGAAARAFKRSTKGADYLV